MNSCCTEMQRFICDSRNPIFYNKVVRECYIDCKNNKIITMSYCPWCGQKLPGSLREELMDTLLDEYQIDIPIFEVKSSPKIPQEFKSDEWWKKRRL